MYRTTLIFLIILFAACGKEKNVTETKVTAQPKPEWVDARPVNSAYYIGIAQCSKITQPLDYQAIAKKLALNDLATEISVKVEGQSFFSTMEVNTAFSESFTSNIKTSSSEQLEDYEVAGIWEDKTTYAIYYRLNKFDYQQKKELKKKETLRVAYDFLIKGKEAKSLYNIPSAIDLFYHGLFTLKSYWTEVNKFQLENGQEIFIDNELFSEIRGVISELRFETPVKTIQLKADNGYKLQLPTLITYKGQPVRGISVRYAYGKDNFMKPRTILSDNEGMILCEIENVSKTNKNNKLELSIVVDALVPQDVDINIGRALISGINTDSRNIPIEFIAPSFYIENEELKLDGSTLNTLSESAKNELISKGMRIANNPADADFILIIKTRPRIGEDIQGFKVAYLDGSIELQNAKTHEQKYLHSIDGVKGIQLSHENAALEAYKKEKEIISNEIIPTILRGIM
jgi:LPP20 lipoprotein